MLFSKIFGCTGKIFVYIRLDAIVAKTGGKGGVVFGVFHLRRSAGFRKDSPGHVSVFT